MNKIGNIFNNHLSDYKPDDNDDDLWERLEKRLESSVVSDPVRKKLGWKKWMYSSAAAIIVLFAIFAVIWYAQKPQNQMYSEKPPIQNNQSGLSDTNNNHLNTNPKNVSTQLPTQSINTTDSQNIKLLKPVITNFNNYKQLKTRRPVEKILPAKIDPIAEVDNSKFVPSEKVYASIPSSIKMGGEGVANTQEISTELGSQGVNDANNINTPNKVAFKFSDFVTPNSDGYNDCFKIENLNNYDNNHVVVFSRTGNKIFDCSDYKNNWCCDNVNQGTYYFTIQLKKGNNTISKQGSFVVLR